MPLKKCRDCGQEVSTSAKTCRKCGRPLKSSTSGCAIALLLLLGLILIGALVGRLGTSRSPSASPVNTPLSLRSPAATSTDERVEVSTRVEDQDPAWLKTKAGKIWKKHPAWSQETCETISKRQVVIGMSDEQVRAAWGRPDHINVTVTGTVRHEQWVWSSSQYAYFDDGVLRSVQQTH